MRRVYMYVNRNGNLRYTPYIATYRNAEQLYIPVVIGKIKAVRPIFKYRTALVKCFSLPALWNSS